MFQMFPLGKEASQSTGKWSASARQAGRYGWVLQWRRNAAGLVVIRHFGARAVNNNPNHTSWKAGRVYETGEGYVNQARKFPRKISLGDETKTGS